MMLSRKDPDVLRIDRCDIMRINDIPLSAYGLYHERISVEKAKPDITNTYIPGQFGDTDQSTMIGSSGNSGIRNRRVKFELFTLGTEDEVIETRRMVGALNGKYCKVFWKPWGGAFVGRMKNGQWVDTLDAWSQIELEMDALPYLVGDDHEFTFNTGTIPVVIEGNIPARPVFEFVKANNTNAEIRKLDENGVIRGRFYIEGTTGQRVKVDFENRQLFYNDVLALSPITSEWFDLGEGTQSIQFVNTGEITMTYTPKWLM